MFTDSDRTEGRMPVRAAVVALAVVAAWVLAAASGAAAVKQDAPACLECHAQKEVVIEFADGDSMRVRIDPEAFGESVHHFLDCTECHTDFSATAHPKRRFRSKKLYNLRHSKICRRCHRDEDITKKPIHASLLRFEKRGEFPVCTDCHGAHTVSPVAGGRIFASEEKYCMSCHEHVIPMEFRSGETASLDVEIAALRASVHTNLGCSDCHFGFSSEEHPSRKFRTARDYVVASADVCRRCHFDKYSKILDSMHFSFLSKGNLNAPSCTDCHGSHSVQHITKDRTIVLQKCKQCHREVYDVYAKSVHGNAVLNESNWDAPACTNCHTAHGIDDPLAMEYHERIPEMCSACHANEAIAGKYGLSTEVVNTYLSDFHGITLGFYRQQRNADLHRARPIAVCTDCHGTHNIAATAGADAELLKANLLNRCRKCHEGATENFPDAWLSHYVPSFSKAPLIFIVNTAYKILLPAMVIGLVLQVLLHIWRYIVNR